MKPDFLQLSVIAAAMALAGPVAAGPYEDAMAARSQGDYATELRLLLPLAWQGSSNAENAIGGMYEHGLGVSKDHILGLMWSKLAADQGLAEAQRNIGDMYFDGIGIKIDYKKAERWYRLAAEQGDRDGQAKLSVIYFNGLGVLKDNVLAYMWADLSVAGGNVQNTKNRDLVASKITRTQIAEAQQLARDWKPTLPK